MVWRGFGYYFRFGDRDAGRLGGGDGDGLYSASSPGVADLFDRYGYALNALIGGGFDDPLCTSLPFG